MTQGEREEEEGCDGVAAHSTGGRGEREKEGGRMAAGKPPPARREEEGRRKGGMERGERDGGRGVIFGGVFCLGG